MRATASPRRRRWETETTRTEQQRTERFLAPVSANKRMAGDDKTTTDNEILVEGGEEGQGTSARGELHSRVGGILECDPPGNRNSSNERAAVAAANNEDGVCRYAVGAANRAMSFFEMCQVLYVAD